MKKITLTLAAIAAAFTMNAQTTYFEDDFNDEDISDWTLYDEDGDTYNWSAVQIQDNSGNPVNTPVLRSASWNQLVGPLTPNNYAVTPAIDLTAEDGSNTITLNWEVSAADASYADENYTVYVATGNEVSDFLNSDTSFNEVVTDNGPGGTENYYSKTLDISSFAGQTVYVAFRHHDVTDEFTMEIDNVSVVSDGTMSVEDYNNLGVSHFTKNGMLSINAETQLENIEIYSILGKKVSSQGLSSNNANLNISHLQNGVYLAKVSAEGQTKTFKFIKK